MIVKDIEYHLEEALKDVKTLQARNKDLREANSQLLSEHYKDEELKRLKKQLEESNERNRHYGLSKKNWNDFPAYQKRGSCCVKKSYYEEGSELDIRTRWIIDKDIPEFKNEGRRYIEDLIRVGE